MKRNLKKEKCCQMLGVLEVEKKWGKGIFEKIMSINFSKLMKDISTDRSSSTDLKQSKYKEKLLATSQLIAKG